MKKIQSHIITGVSGLRKRTQKKITRKDSNGNEMTLYPLSYSILFEIPSIYGEGWCILFPKNQSGKEKIYNALERMVNLYDFIESFYSWDVDSIKSFEDNEVISKVFLDKEEAISFSDKLFIGSEKTKDLDYGDSVFHYGEGTKEEELKDLLSSVFSTIRRKLKISFFDLQKYLPRDFFVCGENKSINETEFNEEHNFYHHSGNEISSKYIRIPDLKNFDLKDQKTRLLIIKVIIHEISHGICNGNESIRKAIHEKRKNYLDIHSGKIMFKKGDTVILERVDPAIYHIENDNIEKECIATKDFSGESTDAINCLVEKESGNPIVLGSKYRIDRIIDKNGNETKSDLKMNAYSFVNDDEFCAEILSGYCIGTIPTKLSRFVEREIIPML